jgi:hypothetical protein
MLSSFFCGGKSSLIYALKIIKKNLSKSVGGSEVPQGDVELSANSNLIGINNRPLGIVW